MVYEYSFRVDDLSTDRFARLKLSGVLFAAQEAAARHSSLLGAGQADLDEKALFWAVTRHKVQITRLPRLGETILVQTWPMPTTKTAYPRAVVALAEEGRELFRVISLWVLMDQAKRALVLPGKSGVLVDGTVRGGELTVPHGLLPKDLAQSTLRTVTYSCLDRNGHMNNTRYLDWVEDLLSSDFHRDHPAVEITLCYASEALEGEQVRLSWALSESGVLQVDGHRGQTVEAGKQTRIFAAEVVYK